MLFYMFLQIRDFFRKVFSVLYQQDFEQTL